MTKIQSIKQFNLFEHLNFDIVSNLVLRASNF